MTKQVRQVDFATHRRKRDEAREVLKWERLLHEMDQDDARTLPNFEIATMTPVTHEGDWKRLDNMATLRKLMELKRGR